MGAGRSGNGKFDSPNGIKLNNTQFTLSNETGNNQIKVIVNYSMSDPALIGQEINAVMKVYSADGSLLKTTSYPAGFVVNKTGVEQFLTNVPISTSQNITTGNCLHTSQQNKSIIKSYQDAASYI
jgi:hypothetical protein